MKASIIIPAWNAWEYTDKCLKALEVDDDVEVIVVDNGSTDATVNIGLFYDVDVLRFRHNQGFARGCNAGAAVASGDILVFLNNDTEPSEPDWLDDLLGAFNRATIGAAGPMSNYVAGGQQLDYSTWKSQGWRRMYLPTAEVLSGFCLAVRRAAWDQIGGFHTDYPIGGWEDVELCDDLLAAGWELCIAYGSFVFHYGQRTFHANDLNSREIYESHRGVYATRHDPSDLPDPYSGRHDQGRQPC